MFLSICTSISTSLAEDAQESSGLLYAWTAATREPLRNWETHYLLLTHLESLISYMLFCYLAAEWNISSKNRKRKKWTTHQCRIIFPVDSSRSPATASKEHPGGFSVCFLCPFIYCWFPLWQHYQPLQRLPCSSLCFSRFRHWVFIAFWLFSERGCLLHMSPQSRVPLENCSRQETAAAPGQVITWGKSVSFSNPPSEEFVPERWRTEIPMGSAPACLMDSP